MNHSHILYFDNNFDYPVMVKGKGIYLYDEEGKEYIDGCAGAVSNSLGFGRKDMAEVIAGQAEKLSFVHRHYVSADVNHQAADALKEAFPYMDRFFLVSGGTEATEAATKLARLHFYHKGQVKKTKIISRWMSYHGYTLDALSYGGNPGRRKEFTPVLREDGHIMPPYCYRCWLSKDCKSCSLECADALEDMILMNGPENVAGFIFEPVSGTTLGCVTPPEGYFQKIRDICIKYDILMIVDEVMCGAGRTGTMSALEKERVVPDIMALAKSIGGGYFPVGAVACTGEVAQPVIARGMFPVGHTWSGNPLASVVIKKTLSIIKEENLLQNVKEMGEHLRGRLMALQEKFACIGDVRGVGLMQGIEFVKSRKTKEYFDPELDFAGTVSRNCMEMGLIVMPCHGMDKGRGGDAIMLGTNFEVNKEEIDRIVHIFEKAIEKTVSGNR